MPIGLASSSLPVLRLSVAEPRAKSLLRRDWPTPAASPKPMRPFIAISRVVAPKVLSAGSLTAISPLVASCSASEISDHDSAPSALERCLDVAFLGSRSSPTISVATSAPSSIASSVESTLSGSVG